MMGVMVPSGFGGIRFVRMMSITATGMFLFGTGVCHLQLMQRRCDDHPGQEQEHTAGCKDSFHKDSILHCRNLRIKRQEVKMMFCCLSSEFAGCVIEK